VSAAAAGPGGIERRRSPRRDPAELTESVTVIGTRLLDISQHGLQMEAPVPLAPESSIRLRLLIGGVRTEVGVRVAACRKRAVTRGRPWGVGVEFVELSDEARERLARALGTWHARTRSA
jgi:PilZ domain